MTNMIIKFENGKINAYAPKAFIKKAQVFGTPEFYEWRAACKEFDTNINLVVKSKSTKHANENKNLTFANMVEYMTTLDNAGDYLNTFETVKRCSKIQPNPTKYVLDWFKATFPNYKEAIKGIVEKKENESKDNVFEMAEKVSA